MRERLLRPELRRERRPAAIQLPDAFGPHYHGAAKRPGSLISGHALMLGSCYCPNIHCGLLAGRVAVVRQNAKRRFAFRNRDVHEWCFWLNTVHMALV